MLSNKDHRREFIRNADYKILNEYLKNMEKLSKRGQQYLDMYNDDIEFILEGGDGFQVGGDDSINYMLFGGTLPTISENPVCDTEAYVQKINTLTSGSFCSLTTQQTRNCDNTCISRFNELDNIKAALKCNNVNTLVQAVRKFIDIVMCCSSLYTHDHKMLLETYLKDISSLIKNNPHAVRESYKYFSKILGNEKNRVSMEFVTEMRKLRSERNTLGTKYKPAKKELIAKYIKSIGFEKTVTSKLIEKILSLHSGI